mmetsp:Transcript_22170/g.26332  ORF Transcript_22170/g.26332 Transcript_22170/m.26332 type:complete len:511 (+) Transcript_22170:50-1582(+)
MTISDASSSASAEMTSQNDSDNEMKNCNEDNSSSSIINNENKCDDCDDGWVELMGKDLTMKTMDRPVSQRLGLQIDRNNDGTIDADFLHQGHPKEQADLGDAVLVDFEGYCHTTLSGTSNNGNTTSHNSVASLVESIVSLNEGDATPNSSSPPIPTPFQTVNDWIVIVGDADVIPGLEMAIRLLPLGKSAVLRCHSKYGYASSGRRCGAGSGGGYMVPPDAEIVYRVHVRGIVPAEELNRSTSFRIKCAMQKKTIGNDCYQYDWDGVTDKGNGGSGKYRALKAYNSGMELMVGLLQYMEEKNDGGDSGDNGADGDDDDQKADGEPNNPGISLSPSSIKIYEEAKGILIDCLNNISAVHLRAKSYSKAKEAAAQAIQYDGNNKKALCRAAKAAMLDPAVTFEESDMALKCAEEIDKDGKEVKALRMELDRRKREYRKREKAMYAKMMGTKSSKSESVNSTGDTIVDPSIDLTDDGAYKYLYIACVILLLLAPCWLILNGDKYIHREIKTEF